MKLLFIAQDFNFSFYREIKVQQNRGLVHLFWLQFNDDIKLLIDIIFMQIIVSILLKIL